MTEADRAIGTARWHKGIERSLNWVDYARGAARGADCYADVMRLRPESIWAVPTQFAVR